jgi:Family of unknown function (DUF5317)
MDLLTLYIAGACICGFVAMIREPRLPRYWLLLLTAAIPQIGLIYGINIPGMFLVTAGCIALWGLSNREVGGISIIATGMLLNLLPMAAHGGRMPIHVDAIGAHSGYADAIGTVIAGSKDIVVSGSPLLLLSDHIPLVFSNFTLIASPGDLIVVIGVILWLFASSSPQRRRAHAHSTSNLHPESSAATISAGG